MPEENKDLFLKIVSDNIIIHPEWAGDTLITVGNSISKVARLVQADKNTVDMIIKLISPEERKRLIKKGFNFDLLN